MEYTVLEGWTEHIFDYWLLIRFLKQWLTWTDHLI
jgi:hypothetical protein